MVGAGSIHCVFVAVLFVAVAGAPCGCGSGTSGGTEPICNTVVDDASTITPTATTTPAPAPVGGTILPGTYELFSVTLYVAPGEIAAPPSAELSQVFEITSDKIQQAARVNDAENHTTTTFTTSGTTLSTVDTCPVARTQELQFTATETEFRVYIPRGTGTLEQVYTRRPD